MIVKARHYKYNMSKQDLHLNIKSDKILTQMGLHSQGHSTHLTNTFDMISYLLHFYLYTYIPIYLSIYLTIYQFICLSIYLSTYLTVIYHYSYILIYISNMYIYLFICIAKYLWYIKRIFILLTIPFKPNLSNIFTFINTKIKFY